MPHYSEDYPAEYYPPYSSYRRHHFQQPPSGQVAPMQYHSRPRRRYSQSQVFDSIAPDMNYPSYITQPQHYGQQERPMMNYPEYSLQRPPPLRQTKATRDPTVTWERSRRGAYQSYPHTSLQQQRQDPKKVKALLMRFFFRLLLICIYRW
ncbi:hypothetical protein BC941DRAFT_430927 [Chlamydoabsidia padenii]|nr:hypothetical protein BC941DRAFT_430927 [Chlamydoabsidia padenii]